ncbi:MAG TPA: lamin tail domain-containing protein, partial [Prolixibacteraceae bacterium]|nr:lamin tail domain-containing protein [Prolixibacteraceae bacterium]
VPFVPELRDGLEDGDLAGSMYEFIEIKNTGTSWLDIGGLKFTEGIQFTFPAETELGPGEFIVLASDNETFASRYGFRAFAEYSGNLANNGEWLALLTGANDTICSFKYNDGSSWPQRADGEGNSLVPVNINPDNDQNSSSDWRASYYIGGSPGKDDELYSSDPLVKMEHTTLITCHNYPNPFRDVLYIDYRIAEEAFVHLSVYNITGQRVATLVNEKKPAGMYQVEWDGAGASNHDASGGMYFYRMEVRGEIQSKVVTRKVMKMGR